MDNHLFDDLARTLAGTHSRRRFVMGAIAALLGIGARIPANAALSGHKTGRCYGDGSSCAKGKQCCSGICENRVCAPPVAQECTMAADCGADSACQTFTCDAGECAVHFVSGGTVIAGQIAGDCQAIQCDGAGRIIVVADDSDVPMSPAACVAVSCSAGQVMTSYVPEGTPCDDHGSTCDGNGACTAPPCERHSDCGVSTECISNQCVDGSCETAYQVYGFEVSVQTGGDCKRQVCDGLGNEIFLIDDTDEPGDDGNRCTFDQCENGIPVHPPVPNGWSCGSSLTNWCIEGECQPRP